MTMPRPTLSTALSLWCSLAIASVASARQGTIDLRPKFEKGQQTSYRLEQTTQSVMDSPDTGDPLTGKGAKGRSTTTQTMSQTIGLRFKVIDVDAAKTATVELIYDSLKLAIDTADGERIDFDSSGSAPAKPAAPAKKSPGKPSPSAPPADAAQAEQVKQNAAKVVGTTLTLTIDRDGNITSVKGGEGLVPTGPDDPAGKLVAPAGVRELWGPIFTMRKAGGTASVGESWKTSDTVDLSPIGRFTIATNSTLKSVAGLTANVDFNGVIRPAVESSGGAGAFQIKDSTYKGAYRWDTQRGMLQDLDMTQIVGLEAGFEGFKINSKNTTSTRVKRTDEPRR